MITIHIGLDTLGRKLFPAVGAKMVVRLSINGIWMAVPQLLSTEAATEKLSLVL